MRRRGLCALLCLVLALSCALPGGAETYPFVFITSGEMVLRQSAGTDGGVAATVPHGEAVLVTGETGDYYAVSYEGTSGYVKKSDFGMAPQETEEAYVLIGQGDRGANVTRLQTRLKILGFYTGTVDGVCGEGTVQAIRDFQEKNGLKADGKAGMETQRTLYSSEALAAGVQAGGEQAVYPFTATTRSNVNLRRGKGVGTAWIMTLLKGTSVTVLAMEGDYLQVNYKNKTGYVMTQYVNVPDVYLYGDAPAQEDAYPELTQGSEGAYVRVLQSALSELGFYTRTVDGAYGSGTALSVRSFQKKNGLTQTGTADAAMQQLLFEGRPYNSRGKKTDVKTLPLKEDVDMEYGDRGDAVMTLQTLLSELGYYHGMFTDTFDRATEQAVKNLQKAQGLYVDGKLGKKTRAALREMTAAAGTETPIPTQTPVPDALSTPEPAWETAAAATETPQPVGTPLTDENVIVIHSGTRGQAVKALQRRLTELGYYTCEADGIYDSDDILAVRTFQQKNGLKVDGIAGYDTQVRLYAETAVRADEAAATATPGPDTETLLKIGATGEQVRLLQNRLKELDYFDGEVDGMYGTRTARAVAAFQQRSGLKDDGMAGSRTLNLIYGSSALAAPTATPTPRATAAPSPSPAASLSLGSQGEEVRAMQKRLNELGYTVSADGLFGIGTYNAVAAFQRQNGLRSDGVAGVQTLNRLHSEQATGVSGATAAPTETAGTVTSGSGSSAFRAPSASEVRYANWYTEIRSRARQMPDVTIYDPDTGLHYSLHMFSLGKHADSEPPTAEDAAIMNQVCGENNWTPKAVWVIFSDGRVYLASTHSHGHEVDHTSGNDLVGHICLHFPRVMSEAEATGPYAVSHQKAILREWERITSTLE